VLFRSLVVISVTYTHTLTHTLYTRKQRHPKHTKKLKTNSTNPARAGGRRKMMAYVILNAYIGTSIHTALQQS